MAVEPPDRRRAGCRRCYLAAPAARLAAVQALDDVFVRARRGGRIRRGSSVVNGSTELNVVVVLLLAGLLGHCRWRSPVIAARTALVAIRCRRRRGDGVDLPHPTVSRRYPASSTASSSPRRRRPASRRSLPQPRSHAPCEGFFLDSVVDMVAPSTTRRHRHPRRDIRRGGLADSAAGCSPSGSLACRSSRSHATRRSLISTLTATRSATRPTRATVAAARRAANRPAERGGHRRTNRRHRWRRARAAVPAHRPWPPPAVRMFIRRPTELSVAASAA